MRVLIALSVVVCTFFSAPRAEAQRELYKETSEGWFIYREDKSCVAYADFASGTMLRFSNRADEHRMYFSAYNASWEHLRPLDGRSVTLSLNFVGLKRAYGTAAGIITNPDGRMGFSGADLSDSAILLALAGDPNMTLEVRYEGSKKAVTVENFRLGGGRQAALHLTECTDNFF